MRITEFEHLSIFVSIFWMCSQKVFCLDFQRASVLFPLWDTTNGLTSAFMFIFELQCNIICSIVRHIYIFIFVRISHRHTHTITHTQSQSLIKNMFSVCSIGIDSLSRTPRKIHTYQRYIKRYETMENRFFLSRNKERENHARPIKWKWKQNFWIKIFLCYRNLGVMSVFCISYIGKFMAPFATESFCKNCHFDVSIPMVASVFNLLVWLLGRFYQFMCTVWCMG